MKCPHANCGKDINFGWAEAENELSRDFTVTIQFFPPVFFDSARKTTL